MIRKLAAGSASIVLGTAIAVTAHSAALGIQTFQHVLLISIDGMHAGDFRNCVTDQTCPTLAQLSAKGVTYTRTTTSRPSDSFPGLMALVSGGSPKTVGAFYDVAYDRVLAPPTITTGNGVAGGHCAEGGPNGTTTEYEEGIDLDKTQLNGGLAGASLTDGGYASIDPKKLPRDPMKGCQPVYPWNFVRTNTIFGVIHAAGGYTAWSDKHPAYSSVAGPGGTSAPQNLDDYYSPEINSIVVALPGVRTPEGLDCSKIPDPTSDLTAWTNSFKNIQCYDTIKVTAVVNEIYGRDHANTRSAPVPEILGMNFQAVSVGQKFIEKTLTPTVVGGYLDPHGTPSPALRSEIVFVDASIARMVNALEARGLRDSTLIIITSKHGQSPIDPQRYVPQLKVGSSPATVLEKCLPFSESPANPTGIGPTEDDISQIWLSPNCSVHDAVAELQANAAELAIDEIFYDKALTTMFNKPGLPEFGGDSRVPDIIVQPNIGHTYTGSTAKQEEHGGFAFDDTNVMLLVSHPSIARAQYTAFVETMQVAPTILKALGLDPNALESVQIEGTPVLPQLFN